VEFRLNSSCNTYLSSLSQFMWSYFRLRLKRGGKIIIIILMLNVSNRSIYLLTLILLLRDRILHQTNHLQKVTQTEFQINKQTIPLKEVWRIPNSLKRFISKFKMRECLYTRLLYLSLQVKTIQQILI
jgi:hypothetical protein